MGGAGWKVPPFSLIVSSLEISHEVSHGTVFSL